ncbi:hypothetical protein Bbelb_037460 [Branchiostoma belcheri]|nr:hypothetical protein Bbelb_037460 [Branchiostoma belcheri]
MAASNNWESATTEDGTLQAAEATRNSRVRCRLRNATEASMFVLLQFSNDYVDEELLQATRTVGAPVVVISTCTIHLLTTGDTALHVAPPCATQLSKYYIRGLVLCA